ncbi:MAG: NAD-dependent epimerase/dehydratase family protein [Anaerolineaceae bacterium]
MTDRDSGLRKVFITGATGFIGGAVARALSMQGYEVIACVRPQKRNEINFCPVVCADFFQTVSLDDIIEPCDVIIHVASIRNRWKTTADQYWQVNVDSTRALLEASVGKANRFIYISSVGVHGFPGVNNIDENFPVITPKSNIDYHSSKVVAEGIVQNFSNQLETVIIRPTITYGIGDTDGMVTRIIKMIAERRYLQIGNGRNTIHLTYIDDLVEGIILAMNTSAATGQVYILSGNEPIEIQSLFYLIREYLNLTYTPLYIPENIARFFAGIIESGYWVVEKANFKPRIAPPITQEKINIFCKHRSYSHNKATNFLGYTPKVTIEDGLSRTIRWMREKRYLSVASVGEDG